MKKELLGTSENTLISHTLIHFIFPKYINCSSLPCLKAQKAHKSSGSLVYLEHNNSIKHSFKRRGGGIGEAVGLKLQAVMTSQYQKLNTWFHRRVQFLFTVSLLSNYNNGCKSFLEASVVKAAGNLRKRKMGKTPCFGNLYLRINSM